MNGAAMNCRQDPGLRPQHRDPSSLHNPGYHLQINRQPNLQPQNSKTLNFPSFSTNYQVDGYYDNLHQYENIVDSRHSIRETEDPRFQIPRAVKRRNEPIDLPVPQFEVDEHSVSDLRNANDALTPGSKGLDLDTRIGLLIKSKALAGMHPIFSDLNDSEESESDLDDPFSSIGRSNSQKESRKHPLVQTIRESFDDPEKPLSRSPSPFLSRATYLFWFNKAIEIKQQAKAQEQALLEQATKRLAQETSPSLKINQPDRPKKRPILKNLMDEISKELKEVIKQEFIREVIEQTAFHTLDDWWEKQNQEEKRNELENLKIISNKSNENYQDSLNGNSESQGSTSPKIPFPWTKDTKHQKNLQEEDKLKVVGCDKEIAEKEALSDNHDKTYDHAQSVSRDREIISSDSAMQEHPESSVEETSDGDLKKKYTGNCHKVSGFVKSYRDKIDNYTSKEHSETMNLPNAVPSRFNTCESRVKRSEVSQLLPSNVDTSLNGKTNDKFVIVNNILDFIFNNVNEIVMQRCDHGEVNENPACKTCSNLAISVDSILTENVKQDPSDSFANVSL